MLISGVGYLGAVKTTLLNYTLTAKHGKRVAVIMNGKLDTMASLIIAEAGC